MEANREGRQQWMCAIVSGVVRPLNVTLICIVWAIGSSTTDADPVADELTGGISFAPKRLVTKVVGFAWAPAAGSIRAANSINILCRHMKSSPFGFIDQTRRRRGSESCRQKAAETGR